MSLRTTSHSWNVYRSKKLLGVVRGTSKERAMSKAVTTYGDGVTVKKIKG